MNMSSLNTLIDSTQKLLEIDTNSINSLKFLKKSFEPFFSVSQLLSNFKENLKNIKSQMVSYSKTFENSLKQYWAKFKVFSKKFE